MGKGSYSYGYKNAMTFAQFDEKVGNRKTGQYGHYVDMYTKRTGNRERVFRVQWYERNVKYPTHAEFKKALKAARQRGNRAYISEWVEKNQTFPYTEDGLRAALAFAKTIEPMWELFYNREDD